MTEPGAVRVLMVCTGNICRSPTAEVVLRTLVQQAGLERRVHVASAGLQGYHQGEAPDRRAQRHARLRGFDLSGVRARRFIAADFDAFDWILAMDGGHLRELRALQPATSSARIGLLLDAETALAGRDVPDPYDGEAADFERVLDLVEVGCRRLLDALGLAK
jgi:protein-tyrosine phosphatase